MIDSSEAIEIYTTNLVYLENEAFRKIAYIIGEYYKENKEHLNMEHLVADLFTKVSTDFSGDEEIIKTLAMIDNNKDKYPSYSKDSFTDLLYELQEIAPLEARLDQINEEIKYANSTEEMNGYIKEALSFT